MTMISRKEAKAQGLKRYFTGEPCKYGHLSERFAGSKTCCQCAAEQEQTPEYKAQKAAHYQTNREKIAVKKAAYHQQNREKIAAKNAAYNQANREKIVVQRAAYYQQNRTEIAAKVAAYQKANPHLINALCAKRHAQKLQATPPWADLEAIKALYEQAAFITKVTGEQNHVDHIIPLQGKTVCGLHVAANLQILTATDNLHKSNRLLLTYETLETAVE